MYNPCENWAECKHPSVGESTYTCECGVRQSGRYCEQMSPLTCPAAWWGDPICGPCNCDQSRGFESNCDKKNGTCKCKVRWTVYISWITRSCILVMEWVLINHCCYLDQYISCTHYCIICYWMNKSLSDIISRTFHSLLCTPFPVWFFSEYFSCII